MSKNARNSYHTKQKTSQLGHESTLSWVRHTGGRRVDERCSASLASLLLQWPSSEGREMRNTGKDAEHTARGRAPWRSHSEIGMESPRKGESESRSVVSSSLWPHGLYGPWDSPGQSTAVGSLSLLQGSSRPRDRIQVSLHWRRILYQLISLR